eukprot:323370-Chlamydomonas_euryale.AAC.3
MQHTLPPLLQHTFCILCNAPPLQLHRPPPSSTGCAHTQSRGAATPSSTQRSSTASASATRPSTTRQAAARRLRKMDRWGDRRGEGVVRVGLHAVWRAGEPSVLQGDVGRGKCCDGICWAIKGFAAGPCSKLSIVHCNEFDKSAVSPSRLRGVADFTCALVREMLCLTLDVRLFVLWRIM